MSTLLFAVLFCTAQSSNQETVFTKVNVIPMNEEKVIKKQDVVVVNGIIAAIGESGKVKYNKNARVIDASGKYLIPGLAEMHAHVPPVDDIEPMKEVLTLFLCNGITTIRGMLGHPRHLELRSKIQSGEINGPHFYTSGPSFNGNSVKTPEAGAEMVRKQKEAGYDFLKLHPGLTKENFAAIAKTAKEVNIPFAGHVSFDVGVWRAIEAGYASIDHLDGFVESLVPGMDTIKEQQAGSFAMFIAKNADEKRIPALMKALKEKNIWVVPTQALAERWFNPFTDADAFAREPEMIYIKEETLKNWITNKKNLMANPNFKTEDIKKFVDIRRKLIYECQRNGVGLLLGSDGPQVFNVPGFSVHHELKYMVDAGLTPFQALQSGTVNVAKYFNLANSGMIKVGYVSDMVLLDANPLENIENTRKIAGVMLGNNWLAKEIIKANLKSLEKSRSF
jgi:imidazolonepropionase-like amidohydrolase